MEDEMTQYFWAAAMAQDLGKLRDILAARPRFFDVKGEQVGFAPICSLFVNAF